MNENYNYPEKQAMTPAAQARRLDITLRQNIDEQIAQAKHRVDELEGSRARMESSGILDMRIYDIQAAMR